MANTIEMAFKRAFKEMTSSRLPSQPVVVVSTTEDSDSDGETRRREALKSARRSSQKTKVPLKKKAKITGTRFDTVCRAPRRKVELHEIQSIEGLIPSDETDDVMVPEEYYLDAVSKGHKCPRIHPYDYPGLAALLKCPVSSVCNPDKMNDMRASIEIVPRAWEEAFMTEPELHKGERHCAMGANCEGLFIEGAGDLSFILKEYYTPLEDAARRKAGKYPKFVKMCIFCLRKEIYHELLSVRSNSEGMRYDATLQHCANMVNVEGEYCPKNTEYSSKDTYEGLLLPIVRHSRTGHTLEVRKGENGKDKRYYLQTGIPYPNPDALPFQF
jgi:hypothetical protein